MRIAQAQQPTWPSLQARDPHLPGCCALNVGSRERTTDSVCGVVFLSQILPLSLLSPSLPPSLPPCLSVLSLSLYIYASTTLPTSLNRWNRFLNQKGSSDLHAGARPDRNDESSTSCGAPTLRSREAETARAREEATIDTFGNIRRFQPRIQCHGIERRPENWSKS